MHSPLTPEAERIVADLDEVQKINARRPLLNRAILVGFLSLAICLILILVRSESRANGLQEAGAQRDRDIAALQEEMKGVCRAVPASELSADNLDVCNRAERGELPPPAPARDGQPGKDGRGITYTAVSQGRLFISFTDGTTRDVGQIVGEPGADGADGRGVVGSAIVSGRLILSYSDSTTEDVGQVVGVDGKEGPPGRSVTSVDAVDGRLVITYSDGSKQDAGPLPAGPPGRGVQKAEVVHCRWRVTYTDGATEDAGNACTTETVTPSPTTGGLPPLLPTGR
jgi:hypothetical protein